MSSKETRHNVSKPQPRSGARSRRSSTGGLPAVVTYGLTKQYNGRKAVDGLKLVVPEGSIFGFLGPNGAGKTTTMRMLMTLLTPTEGRIRVLGEDPAENPVVVKRRVGYLPEEPVFYEKLSPAEQLDFIGRLHSMPPAQRAERVSELLRMFSLEDRANSPLENFSKGMRQKVALAGTLMHDPQLLLLDEPTTALDPRHARMVKDIIRGLNREGKTVVLSTHILSVVEELCTHVAVIYDGRLVRSATMAEIRRELGRKGKLEDMFISLTEGKPLRQKAGAR